MIRLPRVKAGEPIKADDINQLFAAIERLTLTVAENGLLTMRTGQDGSVLEATINEGFYIKLTSQSGNDFAWVEQIPQSGGTWTDGYESGTTSVDPAHEANGTTISGLPVIVWARRDSTSNEVTFVAGSC